MMKNYSNQDKPAGSWTIVRAPTMDLQCRKQTITNTNLSSMYQTLDVREWDGEVQFGTFNRFRICPVLEVPCPCVLAGS